MSGSGRGGDAAGMPPRATPTRFSHESLPDPFSPNRDVESLYAEAGIVLPGHVTQRLEDVQTFHTRLVQYRREFLVDAQKRLTKQITERETETHSLTEQRASLMTLLQTHGALEEYNRLQQRHLQTAAQLEDLRRRLDALRKFEAGNVALKAERATIEVETNRDFTERRTVLEKELTLFNQRVGCYEHNPRQPRVLISRTNTGHKTLTDKDADFLTHRDIEHSIQTGFYTFT